MNDRSLFIGLIEALGILVLEREKNSQSFHLIGPIPEWYRNFSGRIHTDEDEIQAYLGSPFLQHFLPEAHEFFDSRTIGQLASGLWSEQGADGQDQQFEAMAVAREDMKLVLIQRIGTGTLGLQAVLQTARESGLQHHQEMIEHKQVEQVLGGKLKQSEQLRDDLVVILDRLQLGTIMTDGEGRVTFLSKVAQQLLKTTEQAVAGQSWRDIQAFSEEGGNTVQEMVQRPVKERMKVPVVLEHGKGRRVSLEIDVQEDPRDSKRMIFFLYDVTEVHDLRGLLSEKSRFFDLVGKSSAMTDVYQRIQDIAPVEATVLVEGGDWNRKRISGSGYSPGQLSKRSSLHCRQLCRVDGLASWKPAFWS